MTTDNTGGKQRTVVNHRGRVESVSTDAGKSVRAFLAAQRRAAAQGRCAHVYDVYAGSGCHIDVEFEAKAS